MSDQKGILHPLQCPVSVIGTEKPLGGPERPFSPQVFDLLLVIQVCLSDHAQPFNGDPAQIEPECLQTPFRQLWEAVKEE